MTKEQKNGLKKIQDEVKNYYLELEKETNENFGCKIFYSNLSEQTDILFIGINPGTGDDNTEKNVELEYYFQYFNEDWKNNSLAKDTLEVFDKAGYLDKLRELSSENKIVKTNLYYLLTKKSTKLDYYVNLFGQSFKDKHIDWTNRLINLCKPKLIIYEGKYHRDDCPPSNDETIDCKYIGNIIRFEFINNITGLMYSRSYPSAGIKGKDEFAKILKHELDNIYK